MQAQRTTAGRQKRISQSDDDPVTGGPAGAAGDPDSIAPNLRARYLDYCAARISEVFLSLSDERTYALMEEAVGEAGIEMGSLGFSEMMDLVTERLREEVPLPSFEEFEEEYRAAPELIDSMLLEPDPSRWTSDGEDPA